MNTSIQLSVLANKMVFPAIGQPQVLYVLAKLEQTAGAVVSRMPLNFTLCLDVSGSMSGKKLDTVKQSVSRIVDKMQPDDVISIVVFGSSADVIVPAQEVRDPQAIKRLIDAIDTTGSTNMSAGIKDALKQSAKYASPNRVNRMLLLTDGHPDNKKGAINQADRCGNSDLPIICLGFGDDWNEDLLLDLAQRSTKKGTPITEYIPNAQDADRIFDTVYQDIQVSAKNASLVIRMVAGMEAMKVWQCFPLISDVSRNSIQGRAVSVEIGELQQQGQYFLAKIMMPAKNPGRFRVAQVSAEYEIPGQGRTSVSEDLIVQCSANQMEYNVQPHGEVMNWVERVQAHKLQTIALRDAEQGNVANATRKLKQAVTILLDQGNTEQAAALQNEINSMEQNGQLSDKGKKTIRLGGQRTIRLGG